MDNRKHTQLPIFWAGKLASVTWT